MARYPIALALVLAAACTSNGNDAPTEARSTTRAAYTFDDGDVGAVPAGWSVGATKPAAPAATWSLVDDASAPSGGRALALTHSEHGSNGTYNLCWTDETVFGDGRIHVAFKALEGEVDQGGGPIWRAQGPDDYYICRANPLEANFRVYKVTGGVRKQLDSATVDVPSGTWHTIDVEHVGERITCWLNGALLLETTDGSIRSAGGVGLWTKADALTSFDELRISPD